MEIIEFIFNLSNEINCNGLYVLIMVIECTISLIEFFSLALTLKNWKNWKRMLGLVMVV